MLPRIEHLSVWKRRPPECSMYGEALFVIPLKLAVMAERDF